MIMTALMTFLLCHISLIDQIAKYTFQIILSGLLHLFRTDFTIPLCMCLNHK